MRCCAPLAVLRALVAPTVAATARFQRLPLSLASNEGERTIRNGEANECGEGGVCSEERGCGRSADTEVSNDCNDTGRGT